MTGYPRRFDEIGSWAERNNIAITEARRRFAQFVILISIANGASLRSSLVFKGGNALDFVWQPNRSTLDLDFSIDHTTLVFKVDAREIERLFAAAIEVVQRRYAMRLEVHTVRQEPPGEDRTFPTFVVRIGYVLPDQQKLIARLEKGKPSTQVLDVEISVNEPIGAAAAIALDDSIPPLMVATIEDIVAEKLRALLQQPIRNRERRQDLLDIAVLVRFQPGLDRPAVSRFLLEKARARGVIPSRQAFYDPEVRRRAEVDYDSLRDTTRTIFIPFDEAWDRVMALVSELSIPGS